MFLEASAVVVDCTVPGNERDGVIGGDEVWAVEGGYLCAILFQGVVVGFREGFGD